MSFDHYSFWLFFVVGVVLFYATVSSARDRARFLLAASFAYSCTWGLAAPVVILLMGGLCLAHRSFSQRAQTPRGKRLTLAATVAALLVPLVAVKYAAFLARNLELLLPGLPLSSGVELPAWAVPVGISYLTFNCISYVIDTHEDPASTGSSVVDLYASLFFFPKLLAGPITRAHELLPQLREGFRPAMGTIRFGIFLIVLGLTKKHLGDMLAGTVAATFGAKAEPSTFQAWIGTLAFAAQMYADFSGYIDMARGMALVLGIELPENFRLPYLARSPIDFWNRWHISLSRWLRDYLYLPIAVTKLPFAPALAIVVTMALGGIWHGANWTFLVWGLYHAVLIMGTYALARGLLKLAPGLQERRAVVPLRILLTFFLMLLGEVLFRAPTLEVAGNVLAALFGSSATPSPSILAYPSFNKLVLTLLALVLPHWVDASVMKGRQVEAAEQKRLRYFPAMAGCLFFMAMTGGPGGEGFLYAGF
jgi:alginate O-acetyltransferase complex protein AlgI